ncbi:MAG: hypothetical protein ACRD0K_22145 [Egibacteraceae bacterium]
MSWRGSPSAHRGDEPLAAIPIKASDRLARDRAQLAAKQAVIARQAVSKPLLDAEDPAPVDRTLASPGTDARHDPPTERRSDGLEA